MQQEEKLISVIVPIYMIDRYVGICIESIINQTYKNLEIILVDDGSEDRCPELCDLYARKDKRIRVIHKKNDGLVSARKAGLEAATGEYVGYVDGDDWIEPDFYEYLYNAGCTAKSDLVCAGYSRDLFDKSECFCDAYPPGIYEGKSLEQLQSSMISYGEFYRPGITTYVWNKLFKREVLYETQMSVDSRITIGEDGAVTYPALLKCKRVCIMENCSYHYRQREDSMLKQRGSFVEEALKVRYLYEYLMRFSDGYPGVKSLQTQIRNYILSICIIRSGKGLHGVFSDCWRRKKVLLYSAGTFGQQLMKGFRASGCCEIVGWLDDDYWEYRRCCLDVDPVESILDIKYDYVLIATVDGRIAEKVEKRLLGYGVLSHKILKVKPPKEQERELLIQSFLGLESSIHYTKKKG